MTQSLVLAFFGSFREKQRIESSVFATIFIPRGDSMIWDFVGRRPLPVRDYVVSLMGGPKM